MTAPPVVARRRLLVAAALVVAVALLAGCTAASQDAVQAREGRSGLQGTGTLGGRQVAVAAGLPQLLVGDCDPVDAADRDVCVISDTIDGRGFVLTVENPDVLAEGETLAVADPPCASPEACDAVADVAIVSVKLESAPAVRATAGTLEMTRIEPFQNYVGSLSLELPDGRFSGSFDVVPRPE